MYSTLQHAEERYKGKRHRVTWQGNCSTVQSASDIYKHQLQDNLEVILQLVFQQLKEVS
jgi:hypothetical protein